jgi:hypothetical protein
MRVHAGRTVGAGLLCAVAATIALWSGPLLSASSGAMHSSTTATATATASVQAHGLIRLHP